MITTETTAYEQETSMTEPRYKEIAGLLVSTYCEDCGVAVVDRKAHTRYHSIESSWARTLAVLKTAHIARAG